MVYFQEGEAWIRAALQDALVQSCENDREAERVLHLAVPHLLNWYRKISAQTATSASDEQRHVHLHLTPTHKVTMSGDCLVVEP